MPTADRIPEFFIAGHSKSGTTALFEMLRRHPEIFMPAAKEPWFFAEELHERPPPRPQGIPRTLQEYGRWFADARADQLVGEASPQYLRSRGAPGRIAQARPDARIIAIFREPASFLHSLHLQFLQANIEIEKDLGRALELEPLRREGREIPSHTYWPRQLLYSEHVRYLEQLRRFHEHFPPEQVHVILYEDFRADNAATVRGVLRFLGADEAVPVEAIEANPSVAPRSQRLNQLVHAVSVGHGPVSRSLKAPLKRLTPAGPRRRALHSLQRGLVFGKPSAADAELMSSLRERFAPEVAAFAHYLKRDLIELWGYARD